MRPTPSPTEWGSWDHLPEPVAVTDPSEQQQELAGRIELLRSKHDGYFACPQPAFREWLLRRSWEAVATLQGQLIRMGGKADRDGELCDACRGQADPGNHATGQLALV